MEFDLTIHWAQALGTAGAVAGILASAGFVITPVLNRRAAVREAGLKAGVKEIVTEAIAVSDLKTAAQISEVKVQIAAVQAQANKTDLSLATQFGGNGGGLRQELDSLGRTVANLAGRFEQYVSGKAAPDG